MKIIIPMAGLGSRFSDAGYKVHKPLIQVNHKTLIEYTIESLDIDGDYYFVCRDYGEQYRQDISRVLDSLLDSYELKFIDKLTSGATETALEAILDNPDFDEYDGELIVTNCDQYLDWDSTKFLKESRKYDSSVLTYESNDPKNSFAEVVNGRVVQIVEKNAVSDVALVGLHYWKKASDFISSAKQLLSNLYGGRESYVSETYNYLIQTGKTVGAISIEPGKYYSTGTPEDLQGFKGLIFEYFTKKPNTYFIDLDGTVFMHSHRYSNLTTNVRLCPGVKESLDEIDSRGDKIILVSARKESARSFTEKILSDLLVPYDQLILGVSQGCRVIVNDKLDASSHSRCRAVDVLTDRGWKPSDLD